MKYLHLIKHDISKPNLSNIIETLKMKNVSTDKIISIAKNIQDSIEEPKHNVKHIIIQTTQRLIKNLEIVTHKEN